MDNSRALLLHKEIEQLDRKLSDACNSSSAGPGTFTSNQSEEPEDVHANGLPAVSVEMGSRYPYPQRIRYSRFVNEKNKGSYIPPRIRIRVVIRLT